LNLMDQVPPSGGGGGFIFALLSSPFRGRRGFYLRSVKFPLQGAEGVLSSLC